MNSYTPPSGCELVTLASTLSCIIAQNLTTDDIALLSAFFTMIGDNLATIATVKSNCTLPTNQ